MVKTKEITTRIAVYLLLLYVVIFPLGPMIRINYSIFRIHPADILAGLVVFMAIIRFNILNRLKYFGIFILLLIFSYILSLFVFEFSSLYGLAYLVRLISYLLLIETVSLLTKQKVIDHSFLQKVLLYMGSMVIVFGLLQYLFLPDLRFLSSFGWDDHYGRLAGSFLDPGFAGILLILSSLFLIHNYQTKKNKKYLLFIVLGIIAIWLTFSRAAYLGFIASLLFLLKNRFDWKKLSLIILGFILVLPFLPQFSSEGTNLLRTYSIHSRLNSYERSIDVMSESPLFGVGFNNLCEYKINYLNDSSYYSHACSGADSSLLLLLSTAGVSGFVGFIYGINKLIKTLDHDRTRTLVFASFLAVLVHSLFTNSLFYPWVLGWFALLIPQGMVFKE